MRGEARSTRPTRADPRHLPHGAPFNAARFLLPVTSTHLPLCPSHFPPVSQPSAPSLLPPLPFFFPLAGVPSFLPLPAVWVPRPALLSLSVFCRLMAPIPATWSPLFLLPDTLRLPVVQPCGRPLPTKFPSCGGISVGEKKN